MARPPMPTLWCLVSFLVDPEDPESYTDPAWVDLRSAKSLAKMEGWALLIDPESEAEFDAWLQEQQWNRHRV